jgi:purine-binding chemotaxis protein CheW
MKNGRPNPKANGKLTPQNGAHHQAGKVTPGAWTTDILSLAETEHSPDQLAEIWARRAYTLAEPPPAEATGQTLDLLVFLLNGERYGLEVAHVREIYPLEQLTPVPRTPGFVAGVFSARGRLISVIDLRTFLGLSTTRLHASPAERREQGGATETKIVVVAAADLEIGLLADEVTDVITIFKDELEPALTTHVGNRTESTLGIAPGMLVVLNLMNLLSDKRLIVSEELY